MDDGIGLDRWILPELALVLGVFDLPFFVVRLQRGVVDLVIRVQVIEAGQGRFLILRFPGGRIDEILRLGRTEIKPGRNGVFLVGGPFG